MGLLYKDIQELIYEASIKERKDTEDIEIDFYNDVANLERMKC